MLGTTLHAEEMVIDVEKRDGEREGADNHTLVLARDDHVPKNERGENDLHGSESGHGETLLDGLNLGSGFGFSVLRLVSDGHFLLSTKKLMWAFTLVPILMILHDYMKAPIDRLYFTNPWRPLLGIENTFRDLVYHTPRTYPELLLLKLRFQKIKEEFERISPTLPKKYQHDHDTWSPHNVNYCFYEVKDFPALWQLIHQIPCVDTERPHFAVIDGPMVIPPHRAESNKRLRYQLTIEGDGDCSLYTENGRHVHREGEDFLFDHGRYHELIKTGEGRRVVLILDIHR